MPEHPAAGLAPAAVLVVVPGPPPLAPSAAPMAPAWAAVLLVVVPDDGAPAWDVRAAELEVVEVSPCVTVVPAVWSVAAFFESLTVVAVCDPTSSDLSERGAPVAPVTAP